MPQRVAGSIVSVYSSCSGFGATSVRSESFPGVATLVCYPVLSAVATVTLARFVWPLRCVTLTRLVLPSWCVTLLSKLSCAVGATPVRSDSASLSLSPSLGLGATLAVSLIVRAVGAA